MDKNSKKPPKTSKKRAGTQHYKHLRFHRALGEHCRKLRTSKGYSVNRLSDESERLSPNQIVRLENGEIVTTATLYRYAHVLGVPVKELFSFPFRQDDEEV